MAVFLANVGVNASHRARSPLFADGTFRLLPIPEECEWAAPMLRLRDAPALAEHAPGNWRDRPIHLDPDLALPYPSYGDNCRRAARAFALRKAEPGDRILFLARLHPVGAAAAFFLAGELEVADILPDVTDDPGPGWWDGNAHVRRARAHGTWDSFWVFRGSPASGLYAKARPFAREDAEAVFGTSWNWRSHRTELQTIGSYTRTIRRLPS